jgi:O-succinylbenzoic acid--CoA ligase
LGVVLVPINTRLTVPEAAWQVSHVGARLLILAQPFLESGQRIARDTRIETCEMDRLMHRARAVEPVPPPASWDMDAPHSILFTSGTTGRPKGAQLSFANHWWNAIASALNLGLRDEDVWLLCLPLFHVGGLAILLRSVIYGSPVVLHETFDPVAVNHALDRQDVTIVSLVSTMLGRVLEQRAGRPFPASLRAILLGGGPAPDDLLARCAAQRAPVLQTYGLTEAASQVATLAPADAVSKSRSAGKPLMGIALAIANAKAGQGVGEILVRGATVFREYVNDPAATAHALRDGWFHTGDLGYLDADGYLYVVARREDLIISGGENIYPAEIDRVLQQHPAVREAAVVGMPHAEWGQVPVAFVALRDGETVTAETLRAFCAGELARFKIPTEFRFVDTLPRNSAGKLLRRALVPSDD